VGPFHRTQHHRLHTIKCKNTNDTINSIIIWPSARHSLHHRSTGPNPRPSSRDRPPPHDQRPPPPVSTTFGSIRVTTSDHLEHTPKIGYPPFHVRSGSPTTHPLSNFHCLAQKLVHLSSSSVVRVSPLPFRLSWLSGITFSTQYTVTSVNRPSCPTTPRPRQNAISSHH